MRRAVFLAFIILVASTAGVAGQSVVSDGVQISGADQVHERGITGKGVTVGIVGTGFNTSNPEIDSAVVAARGFGTDVTGDATAHGTAVAEIVMDMAPNASLHLATFDTASDYESAVEWLVHEQNVDVLVTSVGFTRAPHDGSGDMSRVLAQAVDNGTVVVAAVGNMARRHWEGQFSGDRNHTWVSGDVRNYLDPNPETDAIETIPAGTEIQVSLTWDDWPKTSANYDLYLHYGNGTVAEASTIVQNSSDEPSEAVTFTSTASSQYYIRVVQEAATTNHTIEVFSATHALEHRIAASSVTAPAVGAGVIGVGAYDPAVTRVRPYSAHGPDDDGDPGVDIVAPDGVNVTAPVGDCTAGVCTATGTSFATPHVGGAVALMMAKNPLLTPAKIRTALYATADGIQDEGAGNGTLDVAEAVAAVPYATAASVPNITVTGNVSTSNVTYQPWRVNGRYASITVTPNGTATATISIDSVNRSVTYFAIHADGSLAGVGLIDGNTTTYTDEISEKTTYVFRSASRTHNTLPIGETVRYGTQGRLTWIENRSAFVAALANGTTTDAVYLHPTTGTVTYRVTDVSLPQADVLGATVIDLVAQKETGRVTFRFSGLVANRTYTLIEDGRTVGIDRASAAGVLVYETTGTWSRHTFRVVTGPYGVSGFGGVPAYVFPIVLGLIAIGVMGLAWWQHTRSMGSPEWVR